MDVKIRSSLFEEYTMQRLYPGCSYGANTFFVDDENEMKLGRFRLVASTNGDYLKLNYSELAVLGNQDPVMH